MSTTTSPPSQTAGPPSSTTTTTDIVTTAIASTNPTLTPPSEAPVRKFPAPCWTQEETLALINAYQDKWYSLRRRNLRSADWDAVAADVASRCPDASPAKTSAQCRHKMEKLRKRWRTERQRAMSLPNHRFYSSSWNFYDLMDAMEAGTSVVKNNNNGIGSVVDPNSQNGYSLKVGKNQSSSQDRFSKIDEILKGKGSFEDEFGGSTAKNSALPIKVKFRNYGSTLGFDSNGADDDEEDDNEFGIRDSSVYSLKSRYSDAKDSNYGAVDTVYVGSRGLNGKNSMSRKNMGKFEAGFVPKFSNGSYKRSGGGGDSGGVGAKRGATDPVTEMVSSIRMLGDGFVKMEKMKMEMVKEIERMRMEMEMKRSEMILESQQLIVNAFVEGMIERKKRKMNAME